MPSEAFQALMPFKACLAEGAAGVGTDARRQSRHRHHRKPRLDLPAHQLSMTVLMTPDMANFSGNVHGGSILKLLDQVAYACAARYAGRYVVTLSVDQVMFREPI